MTFWQSYILWLIKNNLYKYLSATVGVYMGPLKSYFRRSEQKVLNLVFGKYHFHTLHHCLTQSSFLITYTGRIEANCDAF